MVSTGDGSFISSDSFVHLKFLAASVMWVITSCLLTMTLKDILDPQYSGFVYPLSVTVFSFACSFVLMSFICKPPDLTKEKAISMMKIVMIPLGLATSAEVATSNVAYPLISVSLMSIMKCGTVFTTLVGGCLIGVESPKIYLFFLMSVLLGGVAMTCHDLQIHNWQGLVWMTLSTIAFSFRSLLAQNVKKAFALTPTEVTYVTMPSAAFALLPFAIWAEARDLSGWEIPDAWSKGDKIMFVLKLFSIPMVAFVNMVSMFEVIHTSSPLTMAVLVSLRQLVTIFGAIGWFKDVWSIEAWIGLILTLGAMLEYARVRSSDKAKEEASALEDAQDEEKEPLLAPEGPSGEPSSGPSGEPSSGPSGEASKQLQEDCLAV